MKWIKLISAEALQSGDVVCKPGINPQFIKDGNYVSPVWLNDPNVGGFSICDYPHWSDFVGISFNELREILETFDIIAYRHVEHEGEILNPLEEQAILPKHQHAFIVNQAWEAAAPINLDFSKVFDSYIRIDRKVDPQYLTPAEETEDMKRIKKESSSAPPPRQRKSVSGLTFPKSVESDWTYYDGAGWTHRLECAWFTANYFICGESGKWAPLKDSVEVLGKGRISKAAFESGDYGVCEYYNLAVPKQDLRAAKSDDDLDIKVSLAAIEAQSFFKDHVTGDLYPLGVRIKVATPGNFKVLLISRFTLKNNPDKFSTCPHCDKAWTFGEVVIRPDLPKETTNGKPICGQCYISFIRKEAIKAHDYKIYPAPIFKVKTNRLTKENKKMLADYRKKVGVDDIGFARLYGIEVETEIWRKQAAAANHNRFTLANAIKGSLGNDFIVIKEDGSLTTNGKYSDNGNLYAGFEIVSAPCDIETHRARWPLMETFEWHKLLRAWDTETCGLHIHVSRASLTPMIIGRILHFVNHPKTKKFIQKVAGRTEEKYTKYYPKELTDALHPERCGNPEDPVHNRRVAVNLENPKTVEFRIFRGTARASHIIRNLEFVDCVVKFCHPGDRSFGDMASTEAFIRFAALNRKQWPELCRWLELHSMIPNDMMPRNKPFTKKDTRGTKGHEIVEGEAFPDIKKEKPAKLEAHFEEDEDGEMHLADAIHPDGDEED